GWSVVGLGGCVVIVREGGGSDGQGGTPTGFRRALAALAGSASFHGYVLCAAFGSGTFFAFLGGGPHAVVTIMGRSSAEFGIWFALSSVGYMAGNFLTSRLSMRLGVDRMIWWGLAVEGI